MLLGRLSRFRRRLTLQAAEQCCGGEDIGVWEVLDLLTSLADKSLLAAEEHNGATRYRLLETVRQYARERLAERGEGTQWQRRHLECFLALATEADQHLRDADQQEWLVRLDIEHDNLRSALAWSKGIGGDAARGSAGWHAFVVQYVRSHLQEGRTTLSAFLEGTQEGDSGALKRSPGRHTGIPAGRLSVRRASGEGIAIWRELAARRRLPAC